MEIAEQGCVALAIRCSMGIVGRRGRAVRGGCDKWLLVKTEMIHAKNTM